MKAVNVQLNLAVEVRAPRWKRAASKLEGIDGVFAKVTNAVHRFLQRETLLVHDDGDHVMIVTSRLLDVVREDILINKRKDQHTS